MTPIILAVLQIFLLLMRAHLSSNDDKEKAVESLKAAQAKMDEIAASFETKLRFSAPPKEQIDNLEDQLEKERRK